MKRKVEVVMKQVYPVLIAEYKKDFLVYVPDMEIYTEGKSMVDAIEMARDAIGLKGIDFEDDGKAIPLPSTREGAINRAKEDADIDIKPNLAKYGMMDFNSYDTIVALGEIEARKYMPQLKRLADSIKNIQDYEREVNE